MGLEIRWDLEVGVSGAHIKWKICLLDEYENWERMSEEMLSSTYQIPVLALILFDSLMNDDT